MSNALTQLGDAGQAVWLDYLHRKILDDGELARLISEDGLKGLTSNPAIFEAAIGGGDAYDAALKAILNRGDDEIIELYEQLAIADIRRAADAFRPLYDRLNGADGYVSLEVSPYLAMDGEATLIEARRLWKAVDRPNLMIKVPGTRAGVPTIRTLIGEGININVTLLFSVEAYLAVAEAHVAGLEALKANGGDLSRVHGVASFFVSRIDSVIDKQIDQRAAHAAPANAEALRSIRGKVAIANAKVAYARYLDLVRTPRWQALAAAGAAPQRLLWASTGAKDPTYSDVIYVETLIGRDTVNTMPPKTMDAFRDHGRVTASLEEGLPGAQAVLATADRLGLDLGAVTDGLVTDGVSKFAQAFDGLLGAVARKRATILGAALNAQAITLPEDTRIACDAALDSAAADGWTRRLWSKDASLWTGGDEAKWMGWLSAGRGSGVDEPALGVLAKSVRAAGYGHAVLLGMGGSSLGPEVLGVTLTPAPGFPTLLTLDSTDPDQILRIEETVDLANTLFIVSSKSGSTLEPDILHRYFFKAVEGILGEGKAGPRFIAVTDPGSNLERTAWADGFAQIFHGDPSIGGRYSVLSNFGLVPAAVMGLDVQALLATAGVMARTCGASAPPKSNPGVELGIALGLAAKAGRDKLTIFASDGIADVGAWLEQLIAESTGKQGRGLIPVDAEPLGAADAYSDDRIFAYLRLDGADDPARDGLVRDLEEAGHPVVRITLSSPAMLVQEFFRWEVATAVAGAVLGIDPFDQPDVEASKIETRKLTDAFEKTGEIAAEKPLFEEDGLALYADARNSDELQPAIEVPSLEAYLGAHFSRATRGDYVGLLAYLDRNGSNTAVLEAIRQRLRDGLRRATVLGFGPRFLHSTGQAYKGGPNSGVFLQVTAKPLKDLAIPGRKITFAGVLAAQARGDLAVLADRGRRLLRVDLGADIEGGLRRLDAAIERALG